VIEAAVQLERAAAAAHRVSDFVTVERVARQLLELGESFGDRSAKAWGFYYLGVALNGLNRTGEALTATRSALALFESFGDTLVAARVMMNLAAIELDNNLNVAEARRLYEAGEPGIRASGEPRRIAIALGNLGEIHRLEGDYAGALRRGLESLAIFISVDDGSNAAWQTIDVAHYQSLLRDIPAAIESLHGARELLTRNPDPRWIAWYLDTWAMVAAKLGRWEIVAQLFAFTDRYRNENSQPRLQAMLPWLSEPKEQVSRKFSLERLDELTLAGEALTLEQIQALVETITVNP